MCYKQRFIIIMNFAGTFCLMVVVNVLLFDGLNSIKFTLGVICVNVLFPKKIKY